MKRRWPVLALHSTGLNLNSRQDDFLMRKWTEEKVKWSRCFLVEPERTNVLCRRSIRQKKPFCSWPSSNSPRGDWWEAHRSTQDRGLVRKRERGKDADDWTLTCARFDADCVDGGSELQTGHQFIGLFGQFGFALVVAAVDATTGRVTPEVRPSRSRGTITCSSTTSTSHSTCLKYNYRGSGLGLGPQVMVLGFGTSLEVLGIHCF